MNNELFRRLSGILLFQRAIMGCFRRQIHTKLSPNMTFIMCPPLPSPSMLTNHFRSQKLKRLYIVPLIISSLSNVRRSKVVKLNSSLIPCGGHTRHEQDFAFRYGQGYSGLCIVTVAFSSTATRRPHAEETGNK